MISALINFLVLGYGMYLYMVKDPDFVPLAVLCMFVGYQLKPASENIDRAIEKERK